MDSNTEKGTPKRQVSISDLGEREGILCKIKEQWDLLTSENPHISQGWPTYRENTIYFPKLRAFGSLADLGQNEWTVYPFESFFPITASCIPNPAANDKGVDPQPALVDAAKGEAPPDFMVAKVNQGDFMHVSWLAQGHGEMSAVVEFDRIEGKKLWYTRAYFRDGRVQYDDYTDSGNRGRYARFEEVSQAMDAFRKYDDEIAERKRQREEKAQPQPAKEADDIIKPPIGVMPKWLWQKQRAKELLDAINRYVAANKEPKLEWIEELYELKEWGVKLTTDPEPEAYMSAPDAFESAWRKEMKGMEQTLDLANRTAPAPSFINSMLKSEKL